MPLVPSPTPARGRRFRLAATALVAVSLTVPTGFWMARSPSADPPSTGGTPTVGGVPLFATWPTDRKPDAVVVLSGQTWGYLRPCGCSTHQKGGLERRANLIASLKAKGWPVTAADLGDIAAPKAGSHEQNLLKYQTAMKSLKEMGYAAVGLGEYDFGQGLFELLARYTYNVNGDPPTVLSANILGVDDKKNVTDRATLFAQGQGKRPAVEAVEVADVGGFSIGFTSVVGKDLYEKISKIDPTFGFGDNPVVLKAALAEMAAHPKKPAAKVLLYQGSKDDATKIAAAMPEFNVILCLSTAAESEPPQFPTVLNGGKTIIVQVGHKGMSVGVVGFFRGANGLELKYQLVPLTEDFVNKDETGNPVLPLLQKYADEVKKQDLMAQFTTRPQPHPAQIQFPQLKFVGSDACMKCHPLEYASWKQTPHSHAMEALEKKANRPTNRQFDGECVVCHTVGFGLQTGHVSDAKTPHLRHVGCESCHGPGSGHAENPGNKAIFSVLSPWKAVNPEAKLPPAETLKKLAEVKPGEPATVKVTPAQQQAMTAVSAMCMKCHDPENDPKFDLNKYMPKVWHTGLKAAAAGLPPNAK